MYDRNRIFGRKFRPTHRIFGHKITRENLTKFYISLYGFREIDCISRKIGIWLPFVVQTNPKKSTKIVTLFKTCQKCSFLCAISGRIFGRKFRPMWPNIRFRPKLGFPLSVVHYSNQFHENNYNKSLQQNQRLFKRFQDKRPKIIKWLRYLVVH